MAASAQTRYYHGSSASGSPGSDVTGLTVRHKQFDTDTQDTVGPIALPVSGINFGWRKSSKVNWTTSPAGSITNLRWFLGTNPPTGVYFGAWLNATYTVGQVGDQNGITGFTDTVPNQNTNNATNYTSSAPLTVNAGTVLSNPSTGEGTQSFVITQLGIQSSYTGGPGPISSFQVTYRYSET